MQAVKPQRMSSPEGTELPLTRPCAGESVRTQKWMVLGPAGWFQKAAALDPRVAMMGAPLRRALLLCEVSCVHCCKQMV